MRIRKIKLSELDRSLFSDFRRRQAVTDCYRREGGQLVIRSAPFIDDWSEEDYQELIQSLKETIRSGGFAYAAFCDNQLKGFVSVESKLSGKEKQYLDLTNIYVSEELRNRGIGRVLFNEAKTWAKARSAEKLYISAHSAVESQAFYKSMGCVDAKEYNQAHVDKEPYDCQMEYVL